MLDRLMALLMFWGMRAGLAWFIADQYIIAVDERLSAVARALGG